MISRIAIIGYGRFGKVLEHILPSMFPETTIDMVKRDTKRACAAELIIPAVPIREFEGVVKSLVSDLGNNHIVMDVCSVKEYPKKVMLRYLPPEVQIIATHPMFGPGTLNKTNGVLKGQKIVLDTVRVDAVTEKYIVKAMQSQGIDVIRMSAEMHDQYAAQFHFSSQFIASVLKDLSIDKTPIDTASVSVLHEFAEFVQTDTKSLLADMYQYNPYCKHQLQNIQSAVERIAHHIQS